MPNVALITGITGQDGSYLAELLLARGYEVHGTVRTDRQPRGERIEHVRSSLIMHAVDLLDDSAVDALVRDACPTEIYHLASTSFVPLSWQQPLHACDITGISSLRILEAIRRGKQSVRFYQAGSSEMFGRVTESPQNETTQFRPRNPYAVAKVFASQIASNYREQYGIFACTGILYNHESPRRGQEFVTRKITRAAAAIKLGLMDKLELGSLDARRDWGFAGDYAQSMWMMMQQNDPRDFVIGTGLATSVREFAAMAFEQVELNFENYVSVDPQHCRPTEYISLVADPTRAKQELGWTATTSVRQLVAMMVQHDLQELRSETDFENRSRRVAA